ncbi:hypothetical protein [Pseudonocardia sp. TRM90224]|uniref:hypothetical protein n=1 Tax=Pseudonocardia sp. TRM90224 TaxID=2812678 RepID=UPI001E576B11|nr:hypothetical protein [Pseudonocardia sp. TRM90224]
MIGAEAALRLRRLGTVDIQHGLTDAEFDEIELQYGFEFAIDHRAFLAEGLPVWTKGDDHPDKASWGWPNWRDGDREELQAQADHPETVILRAVRDGHWPDGWKRRPADPELAVAEARSRLADVPRMIPVYAHRYLPAGRDTSGRSVLSIHALHDILVYGLDLADYVDQEFRTRQQVDVPFWRDYL